MERVNIGCGMTPTVGWRNFDNSFSLRLAHNRVLYAIASGLGLIDANQRAYIAFCRQNRIEQADATRRIPLADGSVSVLYTCHMVEHLDRAEARDFLREAKRVLAPGGVLRIAVPDIAVHVRTYTETGDADSFIHHIHVCQPKPRSLRQRVRSVFVGGRHHHWMYDGPSLSKLLLEAGFADPEAVEAGETRIPDPGALDLREREGESVYVEAVRP